MSYAQDLNSLLSLYTALFSGLLLLTAAVVNISLIVLFNQNEVFSQDNRLFLRNLMGVVLMMGVGYTFRMIALKLEIIPERLLYQEKLEGWQYFFIIFIPAVILFLIVHIVHRSILLFHFKAQADLEISSLRSANAEASNQLLRQQVQPHFLFNALSVIKSLIKSQPTVAESYLLKLSDFLRMSFSQNTKDEASLKEEIKLCTDYLEMQKIRFGEALEFSFDIPNQYLDHKLPFFSLQVLAENAIKHNRLTYENPLRIQIRVRNGILEINNNLQLKSFVEDSYGQGLSNLTERYLLMSGNKLELKITENIFSVRFKMNSKL